VNKTKREKERREIARNNKRFNLIAFVNANNKQRNLAVLVKQNGLLSKYKRKREQLYR
jgi:hypothetical protein